MKPMSSSAFSLLFAVLSLTGVSSAQSRPHFLTPTQMPAPVNVSGASSYSISLTADGLRAMVETDRDGGRGGRDIFLLQRSSTQSSFTSYGPMGFCTVHDERSGGSPGYNHNGPYDWFSSNRPSGIGGLDLYMANSSGVVSPLASLNSPWDDTDPSLTSDGLEFFFTSDCPGGLGGKSIWRSTRVSVNDAWGSPVALTAIDSAYHEQSPSITDDGLWLFFSSNRSGNFDIYVASRSTRQSAFGAPVRVAELSGPNHDIGIKLALQDAQALVTVMVNGRAVILNAARSGSSTLAALSAAQTVGPAEILSATLRSPAEHLGAVLLGMPIAPIQLPIGVLELDPTFVIVLDVGIMSSDQVRLVQTVLPADPRLRGLPIALQALSGLVPDLRLTNAVVIRIQ